MKYLLDTSVLSDFTRGHVGVRARLLATPPSELAVSTITLMEIEFGLRRNPALAGRIRPVLEMLQSQLTSIPVDEQEARETAILRAELASLGRPIGPFDALIAATARVHRLIAVTSNLQEFKRVAGLIVEDWRSPQVHDSPVEME